MTVTPQTSPPSGTLVRRQLPVRTSGPGFTAERVSAEPEQPPIPSVVSEEDAQQRFISWRDRLIHKTRAAFTDAWREAARIKEAAAQQDRERAALVLADGQPVAGDPSTDQAAPEDVSEQEWAKALRSGIRDADRDFMKSLKDSRIVVPGYGKQRRVREFDAIKQVHSRMMVQMCMGPLRRGVSVASVVQAATTMTALMVLSPDLRSEVGDKAAAVRDHVRNRADQMTRRQEHKAHAKARQAVLNGAEGSTTDPRSHLSQRWLRRIDALDRRERGHRDLFTPDTAAMTEVGLMESAYWRMREPGADPDQVHTSYRAMRKLLHEQMADDGLDLQDVFKRSRIIVGHRIESEPDVRNMFNGLSHGRIRRSAPHWEKLPNSDRQAQVWTGEFEDHLGHPLPDEGIFVLRKPHRSEAHQVRLTQTMSQSMEESLRSGNPRSLQADLYCYPVAFAVHQKQLDIGGLPDWMRTRVEQAQTAVGSMISDDLDDAQQSEVFSNAYVDSIHQMMEKFPDFQQRVEATLHHSWDEALHRIQQVRQNPEGFVASLKQAQYERVVRDETKYQQYQQDMPQPGWDEAQPQGA